MSTKSYKDKVDELIKEISWFAKDPVKELTGAKNKIDKAIKFLKANNARLHCPHADDFFDPCLRNTCWECEALKRKYPNVDLSRITKENKLVVVVDYDDKCKDVIPTDWLIGEQED